MPVQVWREERKRKLASLYCGMPPSWVRTYPSLPLDSPTILSHLSFLFPPLYFPLALPSFSPVPVSLPFLSPSLYSLLRGLPFFLHFFSLLSISSLSFSISSSPSFASVSSCLLPISHLVGSYVNSSGKSSGNRFHFLQELQPYIDMMSLAYRCDIYILVLM